MLRTTLYLTLVLGLVSTTALAQDSSIQATVSSDITSAYIVDGFDVIEGSGLESGPAIQPSLRAQFKNSPLSFHVGGSFVLNGESQLHETIYGVQLLNSLGPLAKFAAGYNYYDNRVSGFSEQDRHEVWARAQLSGGIGIRPGVVFKHQKPTADGIDSYTVLVGSLQYGVPLMGVSFGGLGVSMDWVASVIWNSGVRAHDVEVVKKGVSAFQFGLESKLHAGPIAITPSIHYQVSTEETVNHENELWATIGLAYAF